MTQRYARIEDGIVIEVIDLDDEANINDYFPPSLGFTTCPNHVEAAWNYDDTGWTEPSPITLTNEQKVAGIAVERARRLSGGFEYDFEDARGVVRIPTTPDDMKGWHEVTIKAQAKIALGKSGETFAIYPQLTPVMITSLEWMEILEAADAFREPVWLASFEIQASDPIPDNFTDDSYWP